MADSKREDMIGNTQGLKVLDGHNDKQAEYGLKEDPKSKFILETTS